MKKAYVVEIEEVYRDRFIVYADSEEEAEKIAHEEFCNGCVDITDGYYSNDYCVMDEANEDDLVYYDVIGSEEE